MTISPAYASDLTGLLAAGLSSFTFSPQVLHTRQKRMATGLSGSMLALGAANMVLWLAYGEHGNNTLILVGNACNLLFTLTLAYFK